jgi:hypothetical protein
LHEGGDGPFNFGPRVFARGQTAVEDPRRDPVSVKRPPARDIRVLASGGPTDAACLDYLDWLR